MKTNKEETTVPVEEMAPKPVSPIRSRLASKGIKFESEDDDETFSKADEYMTGLEDYRSKNEEANQVIMDVLDAEPVLAKIIQDISIGATFREAIARHIDVEDLQAMEGDPDFESWNKNKQARQEEKAAREKWGKDIDANREFSKAEIMEFAKENGMTPEQIISFAQGLDDMLTNLYQGKLDRGTLSRLKKAYDYDQAVADAKEEGEVSGRNQKIVSQVSTAKSGDGLPKLAAGDTSMEDPEMPKKSYGKGYIEKLTSKG